jgi:hypothetical protein
MATDKRGNFYEGGGGQAGDRRRRYDD